MFFVPFSFCLTGIICLFLCWQAGKMGDRLMDVSLLLTFNKLKTLAKKAQLSGADAEAMVRKNVLLILTGDHSK